MLTGADLRFTQAIANEIGNFDVKAFQTSAICWLVNKNIALSQSEDETIRAIIQFAIPEAEKALWTSQNSVNRLVMRLYN